MTLADAICAASILIYTIALGVFESMDWPISSLRIVCKFFGPCQLITYITATQTLTAMSIERYNAVIHPHPKVTKKKNIHLIIIITWIIGIIMSIPFIQIITAVPQMHLPCEVIQYKNSTYNQVYAGIIITTQYIVPLIIMFYTYGYLITRLRYRRRHSQIFRSKKIMPNNQNELKRTIAYALPYITIPTHLQQIRRARHPGKYISDVIKMAVLVTIAFMILALPWTIVLAWMTIQRQNLSKIYKHSKGVLIYLVHLSQTSFLLTSLYNPILFCVFNQYFRQRLQQIFYLLFRRVTDHFRNLFHRFQEHTPLKDDDESSSISSRCTSNC
ncbi:uncharacterized protein TRIADDRAFT_52978 [Trichoplax adhaerens]|uniref:G-protein coupled receptors family 1 profile domain-containing protein n=1 Tax=Trichoplax adhaerens TaxID=10228 RepID=B3RMZ2_TRIAD|nr:hypothetical protein TRIADDRAFT_52978 [Trichoplax adhaerens]EDV27362.1 hypothetical protein TRIADDRAFT_52978 [Trichoplax adhaerens]|eukprot:XP_002109196.1 hypothetical protein TRIADDRAFT_52978 [Trichoplax adhaerens]